MLAIAQAIRMVPAGDNSFKYQYNFEGGKANVAIRLVLMIQNIKGRVEKLLLSRRLVFMIKNMKGGVEELVM